RGIEVDKPKPRPIVWNRYKRPFEMFDARAYPKGASVLHMLRGILGDDKFHAAMSTYCRRHRHQVVETDDLRRVVEEVAYRKLDWFFKQWCFQAGSPELQVSWRWNEEDSTARVTVKQTQKVSDLVPVFRLPTTIAFTLGEKPTVFPVVLDRAEQEFVFPLKSKPDRVELDPRHFLLATLKFTKTAEEWRNQLEHAQHVLSRADAATALAETTETDATDASDKNVAALIAALKREKFHALRADVVKALGKLKGDLAQEAILSALKDSHPTVRKTAASQLEHFEGDDVAKALRDAWGKEAAPQARAEVLRRLAEKDEDGRDRLLEQAMLEPSYRNTVARAALELLVKHKHPRRREFVFLKSRRGGEEQLRSTAVRSLGKLAEEDPSLIGQLRELAEDRTFFIRRAAVDALAEVGGQEDANFLEKLMKKPTDKREADRFRKAVAKIRDKKKENPVQVADGKAVALEDEAKRLELKAKRLRAEAQQVRARAREQAAQP
ncbi:MAG: HEAT repeat domain-containing protein, partial [Planctomycetales bacterium]